jgi:hypothetical protein
VADQINLTAESESALILQEKLSHYLDTVEVDLIKQISMRSDSFFAALSTLQELHDEVRRTCQQIEFIRFEEPSTHSILT